MRALGPLTVLLTFCGHLSAANTYNVSNVTQLASYIQTENNGAGGDTIVLAPGTYTFYCSVPGHEQAGMKGTLIVR